MKNKRTAIGSYTLLKEVGRGSFGSVYLCEHNETHRSYAGKLFKMQFIKEQGGWCMIEQEVKVLKALTHHRTIKYEDIVYAPIGILVVMELVRGRSLIDCFPEEGGFIESFARSIFRQLLEALDFLHRNGIVHRDLKLENVMIERTGDVKLIDYGLSDYFPNSNGDFSKMMVQGLNGSPHYYAPELLKGRSEDKFRGDGIDIWAAGIFLFILVSGFRPFDGEDDCEIFDDICSRDVPFEDTHFTPELEDLITNILEKDPVRRASIPDIMAHPWMKGRRLNCGSTTFYGKRRRVNIGILDNSPEKTRSCNEDFPHSTTEVEYDRVRRLCRSCNGRFVPAHTGKVTKLRYPLVESSSDTESNEGGGKEESFRRMAFKRIKRIFGIREKSARILGESEHEAISKFAKRGDRKSSEDRYAENCVGDENDRSKGKSIRHVFAVIITWLCPKGRKINRKCDSATS